MADIHLTPKQIESLLESQNPNGKKILMETNKRQLLKEYKWYNTFLDFVGIVDPTGAADAINAISYFRQGHIFFGFLSLVSIIPYAGDLVAKPVVALVKLGKGSFKGMNAAIKSGKGAKVADEATKLGPDAVSFTKWMGTSPVGKFLSGLGKKISNFGIFGFKPFSKVGKDIGSYSKVFKGAGEALEQGAKIRVFSKSGGLLTKMQRRGLLNRTKLYGKFIGWITGTGVAAGAISSMSEGDLNEKFAEFISSEEGAEAFSEMSTEDQQDLHQAVV